MPDLNQVSADIYQEKLEELFDHYQYDNDLPEIDEVLTGISKLTCDNISETEPPVLYGFLTELLDRANQQSKESKIPVQRAGYLMNVIQVLNEVYDLRPEFAIAGYSSLFSTYSDLSQDIIVERLTDSSEYKKMIEWSSSYSI